MFNLREVNIKWQIAGQVKDPMFHLGIMVKNQDLETKMVNGGGKGVMQNNKKF